ncbi:MAG: hypothetical protein ACI30H_02865 [Paludibacteraceae bacterium]
MKTLKFKCTLLSDVILNQKAATEGPNKTLDFIPGSCFLGIVASKYAEFEKDGKAMEIFHSGKVRFGDAHPSNGVRGLKIPASMFYPKLKKASEELYIHHAVPNLDSDDMKNEQLKQCRDGFYIFVGNEAKEIKTETNFAIKSAYDREKRRSKDNEMYGYESLQKGLELYFEVQVKNEDLEKEIKDALVGKKRVGRSRTAQYGLVEITENDYSDVKCDKSENGIITVYADGRLIFLDEFSLPTFQPSAEQLGLPKDAEILWDKSQIRTFQYAPWNYKRQCSDADRCGIEKGSVFVVKVPDPVKLNLKLQYVGSYNNEGFGKVIYNPCFLEAEKDTGKALVTIIPDKNNDTDVILDEDKRKEKVKKEIEVLNKGGNLLKFLAGQKEKAEIDNDIYTKVNHWVNDNKTAFQGKEKFASQWGAIRGIAMATKDDSKIRENVITYISHGVKSSDWDGNRRKKLEEFIAKCNTNNIRESLVNLAAEMAKKCREEDKQ